ncbi:MAG: nucleotidyl transferase AbiEii/AbiGii toxin family protein [Fibrobacterota bacterium]|nr:nucleotidyl transferase AbiEii/AbiGii toxin family protein [Chitinispirillaceae bacterium]
MGLKQLFESITDHFEHSNIQYAVIGGFALYGYGYIRATIDIDLVVKLEDQEKVRIFIEQLGFQTTNCTTAFSNHTHPIGNLQVDFMYVSGFTADEIFKYVENRIIFDSRKYPVVSAKHLIAMKLFAAASDQDRLFKDLSDIKEIIKNTEIDTGELYTLFVKYGLEKYYEPIIGKQ